jgi:hypothetical protein
MDLKMAKIFNYQIYGNFYINIILTIIVTFSMIEEIKTIKIKKIKQKKKIKIKLCLVFKYKIK